MQSQKLMKHKSPSVNDHREPLHRSEPWSFCPGHITSNLIIITKPYRRLSEEEKLDADEKKRNIDQRSAAKSLRKKTRIPWSPFVSSLLMEADDEGRIMGLIYSAHNIKLDKLISWFLLLLQLLLFCMWDLQTIVIEERQQQRLVIRWLTDLEHYIMFYSCGDRTGEV